MIELAMSKDVPNIMALMKSAPGFWQEAWDEAVVEQGVRSANGLAFVWKQEDEVIGFICAHDVGFRGYISALVVAEKVRGLGIGTQLLQQVEQELMRRGRTDLIVAVRQGAEPFYHALGFSTPDVALLRKKLTADLVPNVTAY